MTAGTVCHTCWCLQFVTSQEFWSRQHKFRNIQKGTPECTVAVLSRILVRGWFYSDPSSTTAEDGLVVVLGGGGGGVIYCWNRLRYNFSFPRKFLFVLTCVILVPKEPCFKMCILKQFLLATLTTDYAVYFNLYFAVQEWLCLFSLLGWDTRMWAVIIAWRKIYSLEYSPLLNTTKHVDQATFASHNHHCSRPSPSAEQRRRHEIT